MELSPLMMRMVLGAGCIYTDPLEYIVPPSPRGGRQHLPDALLSMQHFRLIGSTALFRDV